MGGLVAHSYIQNHNGGSKVNKLITLATPYHGSQLVQLGVGALDVVAKVSFNNILLVMGTFGSHDLAWDNYPNATKDDNTNASLFDLNNTLSTSQYASLYNAFAGSNLDVNSRHNRASVFRRNEASTKGSKTILDTSFKTSFSPPFWS